LSDKGGGADFLADAVGGGARLVADAGAVLVGAGATSACGGAADGGGAAGSAFMMLTGGIDAAEGNVRPDEAPLGVPDPLEASGRVRLGQFAA
jgi:hypothetical protein